ncbi:response regulator transcription factor [Ornithinimicrobium sp. F0845]|uniref:response regulator n=1 Tax=Ornithinimicrobium sp. F0845 TaxID=2926412 RepID=UPI001FF6ACA9|nr:response regulator transcription factor [Ornithinimicrobium sp. F0845]
MIRIVVVDDQALVRSGLVLILNQDPGLEVCGEASDGAEAVHVVKRERPDIVLMDIRMPGMDGIEATRRITAAEEPPPVVVLTTYDMDDNVVRALRAGATGFLLKDDDPQSLVAAVHNAVRGEMPMAGPVVRRMADEFLQRRSGEVDPAALDPLSDRERDVMLEVARGFTNLEIAQRLFISPATVKSHVASILLKLGLRSRSQAIILAYETGLLRPGA